MYISYKELIEKSCSEYISYSSKLLTLEWRSKREKIIRRDQTKCTICHKRPNDYAWWLKNSSPFNIYIRYPDKEELNYLPDSIIYETEHLVLHVHHKYYLKNHLPWDYEEEALITLCSNCHEEVHSSTDIYQYENVKFENKELLIPCVKCSGTGYLPEFHYFQNGVCFSCNGNRFMNIS